MLSPAQIAVTVVGIAGIVLVLWYFLWSRGSGVAAALPSGTQEVHITVKGGYTPDTIVVQADRPVRLLFYREETAECSEHVVFETLGIDRRLPAFETTAVEFTPERPGEFPFRCGQSILKGLLVVEPPGTAAARRTSPHHQHA